MLTSKKCLYFFSALSMILAASLLFLYESIESVCGQRLTAVEATLYSHLLYPYLPYHLGGGGSAHRCDVDIDASHSHSGVVRIELLDLDLPHSGEVCTDYLHITTNLHFALLKHISPATTLCGSHTSRTPGWKSSLRSTRIFSSTHLRLTFHWSSQHHRDHSGFALRYSLLPDDDAAGHELRKLHQTPHCDRSTAHSCSGLEVFGLESERLTGSVLTSPSKRTSVITSHVARYSPFWSYLIRDSDHTGSRQDLSVAWAEPLAHVLTSTGYFLIILNLLGSVLTLSWTWYKHFLTLDGLEMPVQKSHLQTLHAPALVLGTELIILLLLRRFVCPTWIPVFHMSPSISGTMLLYFILCLTVLVVLRLTLACLDGKVPGEERSQSKVGGDESSQSKITGDETSQSKITGDETSQSKITGDETSQIAEVPPVPQVDKDKDEEMVAPLQPVTEEVRMATNVFAEAAPPDSIGIEDVPILTPSQEDAAPKSEVIDELQLDVATEESQPMVPSEEQAATDEPESMAEIPQDTDEPRGEEAADARDPAAAESVPEQRASLVSETATEEAKSNRGSRRRRRKRGEETEGETEASGKRHHRRGHRNREDREARQSRKATPGASAEGSRKATPGQSVEGSLGLSAKVESTVLVPVNDDADIDGLDGYPGDKKHKRKSIMEKFKKRRSSKPGGPQTTGVEESSTESSLASMSESSKEQVMASLVSQRLRQRRSMLNNRASQTPSTSITLRPDSSDTRSSRTTTIEENRSSSRWLEEWEAV